MLLLAFALISAPQEPGVTVDTLAAWRAHIAPTAQELRWQEIPWRDTLAGGLRDAAAEQKPLLLWLMNGHPLGCT